MTSVERLMEKLSKRKWAGIAIAFFVLVVVVAANRKGIVRFAVRTIGLNLDLGYTVHYVVPDGFRGVFIIREDVGTGYLPEIGRNGEIIYSIPDAGELVTSDTTPLFTWHKSEARYRSGKAIGIEGNLAEVRYRDLGFTSSGEPRIVKLRSLIGTGQEATALHSDGADWFRIEEAGRPLFPKFQLQTDTSAASP